jgi:hypothetical protein
MYIGPLPFLETWPPIYRARRGRWGTDWKQAKFTTTFTFDTRLVWLIYLRVHLTPYFPDPKSSILDICRVNPRHPPKVIDLRGIKGGGLDLHLHRSNFISPLICLRDLCLGIPWNPKSWFVYLINLLLIVWQHCIVLGSLQFGCGCVSQTCKGRFCLEESLSGKVS